MFVIKKLRLNDFKDVVIPSRKDLYAQLGPRYAAYQASSNDARKFSYPVNRADMMTKAEQLKTGYDVQIALNNIRDSKKNEPEKVTIPINNPAVTAHAEVEQKNEI